MNLTVPGGRRFLPTLQSFLERPDILFSKAYLQPAFLPRRAKAGSETA